jgi:hypothetical protein
LVPFAPEYRTIVWIATSVLLSVLFDDVAAEIDADTYPAAVLHRLGLPDRVLVLVQLVDIGVAAIFNPAARLPFGEAVGSPLQRGIAGASGICIGVGRGPDGGQGVIACGRARPCALCHRQTGTAKQKARGKHRLLQTLDLALHCVMRRSGARAPRK